MEPVQIVHILRDGSIVQDMKQIDVSPAQISMTVKRALSEMLMDEQE